MMKFNRALRNATKTRVALLKPAPRITSAGTDAFRATSTSSTRTKVVSSLLRYGIIAPALIAASISANADGYPTCETRLLWVATINNQIALTPGELIIRDSATQQIVMQTTNHSGNVTMLCGKYNVTATLGKLTRGRTILTNTTSHTLIIEMGE